MKHIMVNIVTAILIALSFTACNQQQGKANIENLKTSANDSAPKLNFADGKASLGRLFPDKLRDLPNVILAAHSPNPVYAVFEDNMYIWKHNTTVQGNEDLQIIEYGSFVFTDKGWYLRVTMTPADFEENYHCKGGLLKKGVIYTDTASWRRGRKLTGGDAMWYYIAKDKNGRLVKGTAPIETEGKLLNSLAKTMTVVNSKISWTGYGEIGGYSLSGSIQLKDADIQIDSTGIKSAKINIDIASLSHEEKHLEEHLKGEDFFEVAKFPSAVFVMESIQYKNAGNAVISGNITVKGVTKPVQFPIEVSTADKVTIIKGKISIDRTAFGIKYNSKSFFGDLGDKAIKNNFDLVFEIQVK